MATNIIIEQDILNEILSAVGYPLIQLEDLEIDNLEDISELIVKPSLRKYFTHFPKIYSEDVVVGTGNFEKEADVSIENIYNAVVKINKSTTSSGVNNSLYGNVFSRARNISATTRNSIGGCGNDYGLYAGGLYEEMQKKSMANMYTAFRYDFDKISKRKVKGYSDQSGKIEIQWLTFSNDVSEVDYSLLSTFIQYCQGLLLVNIGRIRSQINANQGDSQFNADMMLSEGKDLMEKAEERYRGTVVNPPVVKL